MTLFLNYIACILALFCGCEKPLLEDNNIIIEQSVLNPGEIEMTIDLNNGHQLNKGVFGVNSALPAQYYDYSTPGFIDRYIELGKPLIRFPGGTYANYYDFDSGFFIPYDGISAANQKRVDDWNKGVIKKKQTIGSYSYKDFCEFANQTDADYTLVLNILGKTAADTKRWMEGIKATGQVVKYVEIGNEVYFGNYDPVIPTVQEYIRRGQNHAEAVRAVFADAKIGVIIPSQIYTRETFLNELDTDKSTKQLDWYEELPKSNFYDAVIIHLYSSLGMSNNIASEAEFIPYKDAYYNCLSHSDKKFDETFNGIREKFPQKEVWVTEYHVGGFSGLLRKYRFRYSYLGGLYTANFMLKLFSVPEVTISNWHSVTQLIEDSGNSGNMSFGKKVNFEFVGIFKELIAEANIYASVSLRGDGSYTGMGEYGGTYSDLNAGFFYNNESGYLMVVNKSDKTYSLTNKNLLIEDGGKVVDMQDAVSLTPTDDLSLTKALESEDKFLLKKVAVNANGISLPPFSITRIKCKLNTK